MLPILSRSFLALALATAGALPAQFFVPDQKLTRHVARVTWMGQSGEQSVAVDYGPARWSASHEKFVQGRETTHARLGSGPWATLHTAVDLTFGSKKVPPGRWYLGARRDDKQQWTLTLMAADKLDRAGLGSGNTLGVTPDLEAPMQFAREQPATEMLEIRLESTRDGKPTVQLTIAWGTYRLTGDLVAAFDTRKPEGAPEFALSPKEKTITTASGLQYEQLRAGVGDFPQPGDMVKVHYSGWLTDGTQFDSSWLRKEPTTFPIQAVVKGFAEGLQLMQPGATFRLTIPPQLGYGERGAGNVIPPNATLVFTVTLLGIEK